MLLDGAGGRPGSRSLLFHDPIRILQARTAGELASVLELVEKATADRLHVAGFLSYEAGHAFWEERFPELRTDQALPAGVPLAWFGVYADMMPVPSDALAQWASSGAASTIPDIGPSESPDAFKQRVVDIRDLIHEGDVYQVNHTTRFTAPFSGDPIALYRAVRARQPVGYGGILRTGSATVLSFSPELFFEQSGRVIEAEPMKGTAPRGGTPEQDQHLQSWLQTDEKNRAENLMIVDLLRNDLSMISEPGSVVVPEQFCVQQLPSVHQMTSRVRAELQPGTGFPAIIRALFPCGSITGAPKVRAMRRIAELESGPRGVYCGAIGYVTGVGAERRSVFSVAIRTAVLDGTDLTLGAGGGIVWDSDPDEEYREMLLKTRFFSSQPTTDRLQLIETMRATPDGQISWLSWHMDRMHGSATELGFVFDRVTIEQSVNEKLVEAAAEGMPAADSGSADPSETGTDGGFRVRLLLDQEGNHSIELAPLQDPGKGPLPVCMTDVRIASTHPRYRHKTTDRGPYDEARSQAQEAGCYDGLLINERGEVTEGAITNIFVRKGADWFTPPLPSGLLAGVGRRVFLLEHAAKERVLTPRDIREADEIRITNAVIGERVAVLQERD